MGSARGRGSSRGSAKKSASAKKSTKAGARRGTGILGKLKSAARGRGTRSPVARVKRVTKTVVEQAKVGVQRVGGMAGDLVERVT